MGDIVDFLQKLAMSQQVAANDMHGKISPADFGLNPMPGLPGNAAPSVPALVGAMRGAQGFPQSKPSIPTKTVANENSMAPRGSIAELLNAVQSVQGAPQVAPSLQAPPPHNDNSYAFRRGQ